MKKGNCRFVKCIFAVAASLSLCSCNLFEDVVSDFIWGFAKQTVIPSKDYPNHAYPIIENATSKELSFLVVYPGSDYVGNEVKVDLAEVRSISAIGPGQKDVVLLHRAFSKQEDVTITSLTSGSVVPRFVALEGNVVEELVAMAYPKYTPSLDHEIVIIEKSAWDEQMESRVVYEIGSDQFTLDHWTEEWVDDPIPGNYLEVPHDYYLSSGSYNNDWYTFISWTFTLTDELLAEYAAGKNLINNQL